MSFLFFLLFVTSFEAPDYFSSRDEFRSWVALAKESSYSAQLYSDKVESSVSGDLSVDSLYVKRPEAKGLLIMTAGVHGVEAPAGFLVLRKLIKENWRELEDTKLDFYFVHSVNPYGFAFKRRVNENNVDLNRNFLIDRQLFGKSSETYKELYPVLNPQKKLKRSWWRSATRFASHIWNALTYDFQQMRQAIAEGQYEFPEGIFYGGDTEQDETLIMQQRILPLVDSYKAVLFLDLHTGLGEEGEMLLFANSDQSHTSVDAFDATFRGFKTRQGDDEDLYEPDGDIEDFFCHLIIKKKKTCVPMTIEFGSVPTKSVLASIQRLNRFIDENQAQNQGTEPAELNAQITQEFFETFTILKDSWRRQVEHAADHKILRMIQQFAGWTKAEAPAP